MYKILFILLLTLSGCAKMMRPPSRSTGDWQSPLAAGMYNASPDCFAWWRSLNDTQLDEIMRRAALSNFDMLIARETRQDSCGTWRNIASDVAKNYIAIRGLQLRLESLDKNINAQVETVRLTNSLASTGFLDIVDQLQAEELLSQLNAQKSTLQDTLRTTIHHLSILLGRAPGDLYCELSQPQPIPTLPCQMPIGCPSDFLCRRMEVQSCKNMASAGSGKASLAYYMYEKAAIEALEGAENALSTLYYAIENTQALKVANEQGLEAYREIYQLYERGLKNYLEVLVIQQSHLTTEAAYLESQVQLLNAYIDLYTALTLNNLKV